MLTLSLLEVVKEVRLWLLEQKSEMRSQRLKILEEKGMAEYIEEIKRQQKLEGDTQTKVMKVIATNLN
jgi:hypothetical protein